jgi:hypothetical protein
VAIAVATDPVKLKTNVLHQLVRFRTETTIIFQHRVVHVLEKMGGLKPPIAEASQMAKSRMRLDLKAPRGA